MNNYNEKINQIKWLRAIGIEYYCSETKTPVYKDNMIIDTKQNNVIDSINKVDNATEYVINNTIPGSSSRSLADSAKNLDELKRYVLDFDGCDLKKIANNTVFGDGNKDAVIMAIGEAPGAEEDAMGIPFCGRSGKLLDKMLNSVGISRLNNAYITNTVFWRPPANRQPSNEEVEICRPFVEKHIALINPKLIILVGNIAATSLLGKNLGVTKIRQEYYTYSNKYLTKPIPTTAIFHPAYLLRQPMQKKTSWYDLLKIKEFLEL